MTAKSSKTTKSTKESEPQLTDLPLPADQDVMGGFDQILSMRTAIQQLEHETAKSVISNVRA